MMERECAGCGKTGRCRGDIACPPGWKYRLSAEAARHGWRCRECQRGEREEHEEARER